MYITEVMEGVYLLPLFKLPENRDHELQYEIVIVSYFFDFCRFLRTTNLASYEALRVSPLVCILLYSSLPFPMLA